MPVVSRLPSSSSRRDCGHRQPVPRPESHLPAFQASGRFRAFASTYPHLTPENRVLQFLPFLIRTRSFVSRLDSDLHVQIYALPLLRSHSYFGPSCDSSSCRASSTPRKTDNSCHTRFKVLAPSGNLQWSATSHFSSKCLRVRLGWDAQVRTSFRAGESQARSR